MAERHDAVNCSLTGQCPSGIPVAGVLSLGSVAQMIVIFDEHCVSRRGLNAIFVRNVLDVHAYESFAYFFLQITLKLVKCFITVNQ